MDEAFARSNGRCECTRDSCATHYLSRCSFTMSRSRAAFNQRKKTGLGDLDNASNCEVLCDLCMSHAGYDDYMK